MSAWVSRVWGRAYTSLSIFPASPRFREGTGAPVNGDRSGAVGAGAGVPLPQPDSTSSAPVTRPAKTPAAVTAAAGLCRDHIIAPSPARTLRKAAATPPAYHPGRDYTWGLVPAARRPPSADRVNPA